MRFNTHSRLAGSHALMSPSKEAWVRYDPEKFDAMVMASFAANRGTELHDLAERMISLGIKLPDTGATLNQYVNDAIGWRMTPEQTLYYSPDCYGHADAISFGKSRLRISDLKTGTTLSKMGQLRVYAALFCLEYRVDPNSITIELRIYQNDDVELEIADPVDILVVMDRIVEGDKRINELREEVHG